MHNDNLTKTYTVGDTIICFFYKSFCSQVATKSPANLPTTAAKHSVAACVIFHTTILGRSKQLPYKT